MMNIQKRSFPLFVFLNCITLGIYGTIVSHKIGDEVNHLCKNDGEEPAFKYIGALLIRAIPTFIGLIVGLIVGIVATSSYDSTYNPVLNSYSRHNMFSGGFDFYYYYSKTLSSAKALIIFMLIIFFTVVFFLAGKFFSSIYHKYWWFKQTSRLKQNAYRYNMEVRESGADNFLMRTAISSVLFPGTIVLIILSMLIPFLLCWAISYASVVFAVILFSIFVLIICIFGAELTVGANLSMFYVIKTLNRYSDKCRNGAKEFDPMAYEYYPSVENQYPSFVPQIMNGTDNVWRPGEDPIPRPDDIDTVPKLCGELVGLRGDCAGYHFDLIPGEEIIIGKDAKVASVVIDTAYKEISRKHVSIIYDPEIDIYRVTDYSSNGTWADGVRLQRGETENLSRGTILKLANDKNTFKLS